MSKRIIQVDLDSFESVLRQKTQELIEANKDWDDASGYKRAMHDMIRLLKQELIEKGNV